MALTGASAELHACAVALKAAGNGGLRRELLRGLKRGAAPLIPAVQAAAREKLPKHGGLNEQVAGQRVTVSVRMGASTAGVRLFTRAPDTSQTDQGFVRHPVFNRRNAAGKRIFKRQEIPNAAGWWSQTMADHTPEVSAEVLGVLHEMSARIQRGVI